MPLNTGEILEGRYRIDTLLDQGGMGAVYRAIDLKFNVLVAIAGRRRCCGGATGIRQAAILGQRIEAPCRLAIEGIRLASGVYGGTKPWHFSLPQTLGRNGSRCLSRGRHNEANKAGFGHGSRKSAPLCPLLWRHMMELARMSLKTFWEQVEAKLAACSTDELRSILRAMAWETPPMERQAFLDKLERSEESTLTAALVIQQEDLLADIDDLARELQAMIENADAWEDRYGSGDYYDDEDSLGPYERFVEPVAGLFDRAEAAFDYGQLSLARTAYRKLFEVLNIEDDYGRGVHAPDLSDLDAGEARARYLRAVYETEPFGHRPQTLFGEMRQVRSWLTRSQPMLDNLIQISPRPLPDREQFLEKWITFLRTQSDSESDAWLREAVRLAQGTQGLEVLARAEGRARPRAYLDWFTALEQEGKHREILAAAQEALQTLAAGLPIRAAIADHLCVAAAQLGDIEAQRAGRWEAFLVRPTLPRLVDLWDVGASAEERTALMQQAVRHMQDYLAHPPDRQSVAWPHHDTIESPAWIEPSALAHAYLLAGDFGAAQQLAAGQQVLGWSSSSSSQGLVVAFLLALLSGATPGALPTNLGQIWQWGLENSIGFRYSGEAPVLQRLGTAYTECLGGASVPIDRQQEFLSWCLDVAQQRVDAIVSNQYRGSYDKAATVTAACVEVLRARGDEGAADALLDEVRNRFPRHRAFQAELKAAVQRTRQ